MFIRKKKLVNELVDQIQFHKTLYKEALEESKTESDVEIDASYFNGAIDAFTFVLSVIDNKAIPAVSVAFIPEDDSDLELIKTAITVRENATK